MSEENDRDTHERHTRTSKYAHGYILFTAEPVDGLYLCKLCHPKSAEGHFEKKKGVNTGLYTASSGKNFSDHLRGTHNILDDSHIEVQKELAALEPPKAFAVVESEVHTAKDILICAIAKNFLKLSIVECPFFRACSHVPVGLRCRKALQQELRPFCRRLEKEALSALKGETVTVAIDGGSQWRDKYLAVVILPHLKQGRKQTEALSPFLLSLTSIQENPFCGHFKSDALAEYCDGLFDLLKESEINLASVVTDNASNMIGIAPRMRNSIFFIPCFAHGINLHSAALMEGFSKEWKETISLAKEVQGKTPGLTAVCATRWNWLPRLLEDILRIEDLASVNVGKKSAKIMADMLAYVMPLWSATDVLQQDTASSIDALCAIEVLHKLNELGVKTREEGALSDDDYANILKDRIIRFLSPSLIALIFFSGLVTEKNLGESDWATFVMWVEGTLCSDAALRLLPGSDKEKVAKEFESYRRNQLQEDGPLSPKKFWERIEVLQRPCPNLSKIVSAIAHLNPTEASAERVFSAMKNCATLKRHIQAETLGSLLQINSLLRRRERLKKKTFDAIEVEDGEGVEAEAIPPPSSQQRQPPQRNEKFSMRWELSSDAALYYVQSWIIKNEPAMGKTCGECGESWRRHRGGSRLQCFNCKKFFSINCVDNQRPDEKHYTCRKCFFRPADPGKVCIDCD